MPKILVMQAVKNNLLFSFFHLASLEMRNQTTVKKIFSLKRKLTVAKNS